MAAGNNALLNKQQTDLSTRKQADTEAWFGATPQPTPGRPAEEPSADVVGPPAPAQPGKPVSYQDALQWALRGERLGTMPATVGQAMLTKMTQPRKLEVKQAYDETTGRPTHWLTDMTTGERIEKFGGTERAEPTPQERQIELLKRKGLSEQESISLVYDMRSYLPNATGGVSPINKMDLYGSGPQPSNLARALATGAGGGVGTAQQGQAAASGGGAAPQGAYGRPAGMPGAVSGDPTNVAGQAALLKDMTAYGEKIQPFNAIEAALKPVEGILAEYGDKPIPGVGYLGNLGPSQVFDQEGQNNQVHINALRNMLLSETAGKAMTRSEIEKVMEALGSSMFQSEGSFRTGMQTLRNIINEKKAGVTAAYDPQVRDAYRHRLADELKAKPLTRKEQLEQLFHGGS